MRKFVGAFAHYNWRVQPQRAVKWDGRTVLTSSIGNEIWYYLNRGAWSKFFERKWSESRLWTSNRRGSAPKRMALEQLNVFTEITSIVLQKASVMQFSVFVDENELVWSITNACAICALLQWKTISKTDPNALRCHSTHAIPPNANWCQQRLHSTGHARTNKDAMKLNQNELHSCSANINEMCNVYLETVRERDSSLCISFQHATLYHLKKG